PLGRARSGDRRLRRHRSEGSNRRVAAARSCGRARRTHRCACRYAVRSFRRALARAARAGDRRRRSLCGARGPAGLALRSRTRVIDSRTGHPTWRVWLAGIGVLAIGVYLYLFISAILSPELPPVVGGNSVVMRTLQVQGERGSKLGWTFSADSSETSVDGAVTTYHNVRDGT